MPTNKQDLHNKIIDQLPYGYAYHKLIYDEKGNPNDYVFLEVNAAFELFTGIQAAQLLHKTATQVFPDIKNPVLIGLPPIQKWLPQANRNSLSSFSLPSTAGTEFSHLRLKQAIFLPYSRT